MTTLRRSWLSILGLATLLAATALVLDPRARSLLRNAPAADEIALAAARAHADPILWIDARPAADFARSHIPDALPLSLDEWDSRIVDVLARWQPGTRVIVYCDDRACSTSRAVAEKLRREYQFDNVLILHGGWSAWQKAGGK
jgi:rhodanese-related sulfurtransferase